MITTKQAVRNANLLIEAGCEEQAKKILFHHACSISKPAIFPSKYVTDSFDDLMASLVFFCEDHSAIADMFLVANCDRHLTILPSHPATLRAPPLSPAHDQQGPVRSQPRNGQRPSMAVEQEELSGGYLPMAPEFSFQACGDGEARFGPPLNALVFQNAVEPKLESGEAAFFVEDFEPPISREQRSCSSHLPKSERQQLTSLLPARMLPEITGCRRFESVDDLTDEAVVRAIKLEAGEPLDNLPAISRKPRAAGNRGEVFAKYLKPPQSIHIHVQHGLRFPGGPLNPERCLSDVLPFARDLSDGSSQTDEELAVNFPREMIEDEMPVEAVSADVHRHPYRRREAERSSGVNGVTWHKDKQSWEAKWNEGSTCWREYFPVAKFGEAESLRLAIDARKKAEDTRRAALARVCARQSGHAGMSWNERGKAWQARLQKNRKQFQKYFPVKTFGGAEALRQGCSLAC